ncbi:Trehalose monomycolate exporter MmpL3 [Streptomyces hundungensis]|uniref:Trehalose monomycolate exporter MmpL3 n=1 Tax=Streptomyces hundungensis TaxID=1077946 RepID=A0A387HD61_9ACTN|nr:MMPL family transporter [Streptomyces hundungensis]AYG78692.1 Trehalose monomycolate exporter MmpL3 [Streptomyces hundungensis]
MLDRLAALVTARRTLVLVLSLLFCVMAGGLGATLTTRLSAGGFDVPDAESTRATRALSTHFDSGEPNLVLRVEAVGGVDGAEAVREGEALTRRLAAEPGVQQAVSYWTLAKDPALRSRSADSALVLAHLEGDEDQVGRYLDTLRPRYENPGHGLTVEFGGRAEVDRELNEQIQKDLMLAEALVLPLTLILLVFVFRGVIAALLPLALGVVAILGAFAALRLLTEVTDVSVFAINLTTGLGLGLGIDYSLFIVNRYREELAAGATVGDAIATSVRTAGRTVLYSAVTVALSLSALLLFPMYFLRSFAYAGIAVVAFAALSALVLLPALLAVLGTRVNTWSWTKRAKKPPARGFWSRLAGLVVRRPVPLATAAIVVLLLLGSPFLGVTLNLADERSLPPGAEAHRVGTALLHDYPARETDPVLVVADDSGPPAGRSGDIDAYAKRLSALDHVSRVDGWTGTYAGGRRIAPPTEAGGRYAAANGTWLSVVSSVDPYGDAGQKLVRDIRTAKAPFDVTTAGTASAFRDTMDALTGRMPYCLLLIAVTTFILLFLLTGSVVMPIKAIALNLLSLSATFGALVWVFQEGHLRWLIGDFTVTGGIVATTPIMVFCLAFGLSMDYEVFLLSRIKEEYDATGDTVTSVVRGLERTGGIVTAAAALVALVFLSFLTSGITYMKMLGLGLALAVVMDATVVRGVLVPAFMRLAGRFNWWAPAPLARLHRRIGLDERAGETDR